MDAEAQELLSVGLEAVSKANNIILDHYQTGIGFSSKDDGSPVTIADKKAEEVIRATISAAFPSHGFIGEEFAVDNASSQYQWIIDPIDGTKNFMRGVPFFTTELALFKNGIPYLGISHIPTLAKTVSAVKGEGTTINGQKVHVSSTNTLERAYLIVGSLKYFKLQQKLTQLLDLSTNTLSLKCVGEAWSYHLLAQGSCDAVIEAQTKIWDIAAQATIIPEAGGTVSDITGKTIDLHSTSMLASNPELHPQLLIYFGQKL